MANSEWEVVPDEDQQAKPQSEWEVVKEEPISQQRNPGEPFALSLMRAPGRILEDTVKSGYNAIRNIPSQDELAKDIGGVAYTATTHPGSLMNQAAAGITQQGHNLLNAPSDFLKYGAERLNLVPEDVANQFPRQKDISSELNQYFGEPKYAGEKFLRDKLANSEKLLGMAGVLKTLNPMKMTSGNIAKEVIREGEKQYTGHQRLYNNLFDQADRGNFTQAHFDPHLVGNNLAYIRQYQTPRQYRSIENFMHHPDNRTAHSAVSDLKTMVRNLDEKAKTGPLTTEERNLYDALTHTQRHIENNMFRSANGQPNNWLRNKYSVISNSYRENVVPYRYNKAIQDYQSKDITAKELVESLKKGSFAAKKGYKHPSLNRADALKSLLRNAGVTGGLFYGGNKGLQYLTGKE